MSKFVPHSCDFCFASVKHGSEMSRVQLMMSWFTYWMQFLKRCDVRGVVVFDIDDTLVDGDEVKIDPVVKAFNRCVELGFKCAIVTARPEGVENRRETVRMLQRNDVQGWESLYMMPSNVRTFDAKSISRYKRSARDDIESRYRILANIGDMWHDLVRFPLVGPLQYIESFDHTSCGVLFPPMSHGEVAVKMIGHLR